MEFSNWACDCGELTVAEQVKDIASIVARKNANLAIEPAIHQKKSWHS
jgi:hypothetical protein